MRDDDVVLAETTVDEAKAEQAFKDYLLMSPRSIDKLLTDPEHGYWVRNQRHKGSVPTTNRSTIYRWAKEYRWVERAAEHDKRIAQSDIKSYDAMRSLRFDNLFQMSDAGVKALENLISSESTPPKVRLDAVKTLFDRIGLSENLVQATQTQTKQVDIPDPDSSEDLLNRWLAEQRR